MSVPKLICGTGVMIPSSPRLIGVKLPRQIQSLRASSARGAAIIMVICGTGFTSCGSSSATQSPTTSVLTVQPAVYATIPAVVYVPASTSSDTIPGEQQHKVIPGDYLYLIADRYCTTAVNLAAYNGWRNGLRHNLLPGAIVKIPVGACTPP